MKKNKIFAFIGAIFGIVIIASIVFIVTQPKKVAPVPNTTHPKNALVSKNPGTSARNFILYAGNMGKSATAEEISKMNTDYQTQLNRKESFIIVKGMLADGPLKRNGQESYMDEVVPSLLTVYNVNEAQILTKEPIEPTKIKQKTESGEIERESVIVPVTFTSGKLVYTYPTDASEDKQYVPELYTLLVKDLKVQLIKIDDYWYVYNLLNPGIVTDRLSTFNGDGNPILGERKVQPALR